jgi:hypothetical protein
MTKQEAYREMLLGFKMKHQHYSPEEFVFINADGQFETEDGCIHGGVNDEFWSVYQKWENGWAYFDTKDREFFMETTKISSFDNPYIYQIKNHTPLGFNLFPPTKKQVLDSVRVVPARTNVEPNRNDKCACLSGLKYKKCCGKSKQI